MLIACTGKFRMRNGAIINVHSIDDAPRQRPDEPIRGTIHDSYVNTSWHVDGTWSDNEHSFDLVEKIEC